MIVLVIRVLKLQKIKIKDIDVGMDVKTGNKDFYIQWFDKNTMFATHMLELVFSINEILDNTKVKYACYNDGQKYIIRFISDNIKYPELYIGYDGRIINRLPSSCMTDATVWFAAIKMGFFKWKSKWKFVLPIKSDNDAKLRIKRNLENDNLVLELMDKYYKKVRVDVNYFDMTIFDILKRLKKLRNLKQYRSSDKALAISLKELINGNRDTVSGRKNRYAAIAKKLTGY